MVNDSKVAKLKRRLRFSKFGTGPYLIVIGGSLEDWGYSLELLSKEFTLVIPFFGYDVFKKQPNLTLDNYLEIIVRELEIEEFSILSHSIGVFTSLIYSLNNPGKVKNLILSNLPELSESDNLKYELIFDTLDKKKKRSNPSTKFFWFETVRNQLRILASSYHSSNPKINVLMISGEKDIFISSTKEQSWEKMLKIQKSVVIKHCGHFPMLDNPIYFCMIIKEFIYKNQLIKI